MNLLIILGQPSTMRPVTEVLPGHTTHLSGTFSRVTGSDQHRSDAVQLMKTKALYSARSLAVLGLAMDKFCAMPGSFVVNLQQPSILSEATTSMREMDVLLEPLPVELRATDAEVRARVQRLCDDVPDIVIRSPDDVLISIEEAKA
eukprot:7040938-Prymnesium_polylepis.1